MALAAAPAVQLPADWDDVDAWRIYADRLMARGDPHGDLVAHELAGPPEAGPARLRADAAARPETYGDLALWLAHPTATFQPGQGAHAPGAQTELPAYACTLTWRYGYLAAATVRDTRHLAALLGAPPAWPLTDLTLRLGFPGAVEVLFAQAPPRLTSLRAICTGAGPLCAATARAVLAGDGLLALRELVIEGADVDRYVEALLASPTLGALRRLMLRGGRLMPEAVAALVAGRAALRGLEILDLSQLAGPVRQAPALAAALGDRLRI